MSNHSEVILKSPSSGGLSTKFWILALLVGSGLLAFSTYHYVLYDSLFRNLESYSIAKPPTLWVFVIGHFVIAAVTVVFFVYSFQVVREFRPQQVWLSQGKLTVFLYFWLLLSWIGLGFPLGQIELVAFGMGVLTVLLGMGFRASFQLEPQPERMLPYPLAASWGPAILFFGIGIALLSFRPDLLWYLVPMASLVGAILFLVVYRPWRLSKPNILVWLGMAVVVLGPLLLKPYAFLSLDRLAQGDNVTVVNGIKVDPRLNHQEKLLLLDPTRFFKRHREDVVHVVLSMWEKQPKTFEIPIRLLFYYGKLSKLRNYPLVSYFKKKPEARRSFLTWLLAKHAKHQPVGYGDDLFCPIYEEYKSERGFLKDQLIRALMLSYLPKSTLQSMKEPTSDKVKSKLLTVMKTHDIKVAKSFSSILVTLNRCMGKNYQNEILAYTLKQFPKQNIPMKHLYWLHWLNQLTLYYNKSLTKEFKKETQAHLMNLLKSKAELEQAQGAYFLLRLCQNPPGEHSRKQMCQQLLSTRTLSSIQKLERSKIPTLRTLGWQMGFLIASTTKLKAQYFDSLMKAKNVHGPIPILELLKRWGKSVYLQFTPETATKLGNMFARQLASMKEIPANKAGYLYKFVRKWHEKAPQTQLLNATLALLQRQNYQDAFWTLYVLPSFGKQAALALPVLDNWVQTKTKIGFTMSGRIRIFLRNLGPEAAPFLPSLEKLIAIQGNPYFRQLGLPSNKLQVSRNIRMLRAIKHKTATLEQYIAKLKDTTQDSSIKKQLAELLNDFKTYKVITPAQAKTQLKRLESQLSTAIKLAPTSP